MKFVVKVLRNIQILAKVDSKETPYSKLSTKIFIGVFGFIYVLYIFNFYQEIHIIKIEKVSQAQLCKSLQEKYSQLYI